MTDVSKNTVVNLLVELGEACSKYQSDTIRGIRSRRVQCDEIWSFVGAKEKNTTAETKSAGWRDVWTWTALDADSKLIISFCLGDRTLATACGFMADVAGRLANCVQLTTDGHRPYLAAVEDAFGEDIDSAMLARIYGADSNPEKRYSPSVCLGRKTQDVTGAPDAKHISTSYVERQNLTMRMPMRRFTRLTNAFSKKLEHHAATVALYFMYYNFARVHQTLRATSAMKAGISDHEWSIEEIVGLL
jgi:IS1 family transposase